MAEKPPFRVRALGEIAIRCADLEAMFAFYHGVLGLEVLEGGHRDGIVFFKLGESYGGHTAVLALFGPGAATRPGLHPEGSPVTGGGSSLHHLALTVDAAEQDAVLEWYAARGIAHRVEEFGWIGWRGIFASDPEGNTVELVARVPPAA